MKFLYDSRSTMFSEFRFIKNHTVPMAVSKYPATVDLGKRRITSIVDAGFNKQTVAGITTPAPSIMDRIFSFMDLIM